ncbi:SPFH domain-containing protein [Pedococcus bigeumensis]|uniref:Slipin family protein n=1 Tax=Pedococcus bigeumensis TaxID=433644 RepID=A0A502CQ89_9MICO|nr:SPFH domain-containing protein [Pedococcus bigeumensis]TPG14844.1 slipin family protein [Pedococcus bigeumensis]
MNLFAITIDARECALRYRHGRLEQVLPAGRHRRVRGSRYVRIDLRDALLALSPQEVMTSDAVPVKVTATVRWSVGDPVAFVEQSTDPLGTVYLAAQVALRDALAGASVEALSVRGAALPVEQITGATAAVAARVGVEVSEVVVKDVILPAEVRHAAAELVTARHRGAAQLETARAETAALRSLANGAKLLDAHPALAQLRMVQSVPVGTQLVLRVGAPDPTTQSVQ